MGGMENVRKAIIAVLLLCCALCAHAQQARPILSILDLRTSGVSKADADVLLDYLSSHVVESGEYTVIDRSQRETVLKEIEFSQSDCTDEACQLRIGKLLSANRIVIGSVGKLDQVYLLNLKMIEVETGRLMKAVSGRYESMGKMIGDGGTLVASLIGPIGQAQAAEPPAEAKSALIPAPPAKTAPAVRTTPVDPSRAALARARFMKGGYSFALPGLGQIANGNTVRGLLYHGIDLGYLGWCGYLASLDKPTDLPTR
jgi:hypothetical protein